MTDAGSLRAFVDELAAGGVADAIVCPGSRSTPLALALRANPAIRVRVLLDERSAGFFALGLARAARRPVAVCVTSGTAVANLLPAAVEATLGRVPLVLLTADRPAELRDRGAPQTIDQANLFGVHAKWFAELPLPDGSPAAEAHLRAAAARAVATAVAGPAGPVHLNAPFREPLIPAGDLRPPAAGMSLATHPFARVVAGRRTLEPVEVAALADRLRASQRGLIAAGSQDDPLLPAALARLAGAAGYPIFADPLSGTRVGPHDRSRVLVRGDLLLRPTPWRDAHLPALVVRFGAMPTSKAFLQALDAARPELLVVDGDGGWREPAILPATFVHADARWLANALADALLSAGANASAAALAAMATPAPSVPAVAAPAAGSQPAFDGEITQPRPRELPAATPTSAALTAVPAAGAPPAPGRAAPGSVMAAADATPERAAPERAAPGGAEHAASTTRPATASRAWLDTWLAADRAADQALRSWLGALEARGEAFEGAPFAHLGEVLPANAILWAGSSMPVRDLDAWLPTGPRPFRVLANRGANGIDGVVSSALGAAAAGVGRVTLVVGDVSFLHDIGGLLAAARHRLTLTIVLVHNDGGGIFSLLPQATADAPGAGAAPALRGAVRDAARHRRRRDRDRLRRHASAGRAA